MFIGCGREEKKDSSTLNYPVPPVIHTTDLGIEIAVREGVDKQYRIRWNQPFKQINWNRIDDFFIEIAEHLEEYYGLKEKLIEEVAIDPDDPFTTEMKLKTDINLTIIIEKWDPTCVDQEIPGSKEMKVILPGWGLICVDGAFLPDLRWPIILLHLGDDDGIGSDAFCDTALDWELGNYILFKKGDDCWKWPNETWPRCIDKHPSGRNLGLCEEEGA